MPTSSSIRDTLQAVGEAIIQHIYFVLESGRYPLDRRSSALLKSMQAKAVQGRNAAGRFEGFTANASLELYALDYLEYLDRGRAKFTKRVPIDALLVWIRKKKLGLPARSSTGKFQSRRSQSTGRRMSANQLAFAIQTSIYRNGIRGRHFLTPAFDKGQELLDIYLNNQLLDDATIELDRVFKKAA
ncbi:hypothetical protein [Hymenobacter tenuis]